MKSPGFQVLKTCVKVVLVSTFAHLVTELNALRKQRVLPKQLKLQETPTTQEMTPGAALHVFVVFSDRKRFHITPIGNMLYVNNTQVGCLAKT